MLTPEERAALVSVTLRLTRAQIEAIDGLIAKRNANGGPTRANRQTMLSYFVDAGLKDAAKPR